MRAHTCTSWSVVEVGREVKRMKERVSGEKGGGNGGEKKRGEEIKKKRAVAVGGKV